MMECAHNHTTELTGITVQNRNLRQDTSIEAVDRLNPETPFLN